MSASSACWGPCHWRTAAVHSGEGCIAVRWPATPDPPKLIIARLKMAIPPQSAAEKILAVASKHARVDPLQSVGD